MMMATGDDEYDDNDNDDDVGSFGGLIPVFGPVGPSLGRPTALP
jgi:hypothetical protein